MKRRLTMMLLAIIAAAPLLRGAERFAGKTLRDALQELEKQGLALIYSDDVVTSALVVRNEPKSSRPREILDELLREHALRAKSGAGGTLVIVRDTRRRGAERKEERHAAAAEAMPVTLAEIDVTPSRFTILSDDPAGGAFLTRKEVRRVPHLSDDLYRAIGRIPGATSADVSARFNLRGGEEDEVTVLVDGAEIYDPFHLRDLSRAFSSIDAETVGEVSVLSGGFPAEYGGRMSGVVDIRTLTPSKTSHEVGISLLNTRLLSQGVFAKGSWLVSLRRGYLREVLSVVGDVADVNPRYYDLLGNVTWKIADDTSLSGHLLASRDRLSLADGPVTKAQAAYDDRHAWLNLRKLWGGHLFTESVLSAATMTQERHGVFDNAFDRQRGALDERRETTIVAWKNDASFDLSTRQLLKFGVSAKHIRGHFDVEGTSTIPFAVFNLGAPEREVHRSVHVDPAGHELTAYVAQRMRVSRNFVAEAGLRAASESHTPDAVSLSPRLNALWTIAEHTALRMAWGLFHQAQGIQELQVGDGVEAYAPAQRAEHYVLGLDHVFRGGEVRLDLYDKRMTHLRPRYENLYDNLILFPELRADRIRVAPESGRARGAELLIRSDPEKPFSASLSYTASRVTDRIEGEDVPRKWDQPHAATFSANYRRGTRWNFNLSGTWHTGWPTTPVEAHMEGATLVSTLATRNSERLPMYQRLDARISRETGALTWFVELFNILGRENVTRVSGFEFTNDGQTVRVEPITESVIGVLPSFGVTWRF
jgi:hypothetical protein